MIMNMLQYSIHYVGSWRWFAYAECQMYYKGHGEIKVDIMFVAYC
jgi:hypothetical protein